MEIRLPKKLENVIKAQNIVSLSGDVKLELDFSGEWIIIREVQENNSRNKDKKTTGQE